MWSREALGQRDQHERHAQADQTIDKFGLVGGVNKLVPVGYGINKLQVMCVVEDDIEANSDEENPESDEDGKKNWH